MRQSNTGVSCSLLGLVCVLLAMTAGCGDSDPIVRPDQGGGAPQNAGGAPGGALPGADAPQAPVANGAPAGGTQVAVATTEPEPPAFVEKLGDPLVYIPQAVTIATGGRLRVLSESSNPLARSLVDQSRPLLGLVARMGLKPEDVETFWSGSDAEAKLQVVCLVTAKPFEEEKIRTALGAEELEKIGRWSAYLIPAGSGQAYAFCPVDNRTLLIGRKSSLEAALIRPETGAVRRGIAALNVPAADFWVAGDTAEAAESLARGLPAVGRFDHKLKSLNGFAVAYSVEGLTPIDSATPGTAGTVLPGALPGTNPTPPPVPVAPVVPAVDPNLNLPASTPTGEPAKPIPGMIVRGGLSFESAPDAETLKTAVDGLIAAASRRNSGKSAPPAQPATVPPSGAAPPVPPTVPNPVAPVVPPADPNPGVPTAAPGLPGGVALPPDEAKVPVVAAEVVEAPYDPHLKPVLKRVAQNANATPWALADKTNVQLGYRFEPYPAGISISSQLARSMGLTGLGDALLPSPLAALNDGFSKWRADSENGKGLTRVGGESTLAGYSWMVQLLPFLGREDIYSRFDFDETWTEKQNRELAQIVIPEFLNPADPRTQWDGYPFDGLGLTHFAGMSGVEDGRNVVAAALPRSDPRAGIFGYDAIAKPQEITDGLSNTIMLIGTGRLAGPWVQGGGATIRGAREPYFGSLSGFGSSGVAQSGTFTVMADGSVRVISSDIDPALFRAMCTMHGKDAVDLQAQSSGQTKSN